MSQEKLGELAFCSGTYVGQFEAATRRPQEDLSRQFDEIFKTGEHLRRLCRLARKSKHADYFADAAELETRATTICEYSPMLVPGLLQTKGYARALSQATQPLETDEVIEGNVQTGMERAKLLDSPTRPVLWEIIHEAALSVPVGGPDVMHEQLRRLVSLAESRTVMMQIQPVHSRTTHVHAVCGFADVLRRRSPRRLRRRRPHPLIAHGTPSPRLRPEGEASPHP